LIADRATRERIATALDTTFLVEAAAGTGKTTVLVQRIVETLAAGEDVASIAAVTFTDKAAGELKLRLRAGLEEARRHARDPRRRHLESALSRLEEAHVSTLHTFAQELLRERPIEAGVDPRFSPCSDGEARALFDEVVARWLERALAKPSVALRRALARPNLGARELAFAARDLSEHRMLDAPWTRHPWDRAAAVRALRESVAKAGETDTSVLGKRDVIAEGFDAVRLTAKRMERATDEEREGIALELTKSARLVKALDKGRGAPHAKKVLTDLMDEIAAFDRVAAADLAFELREELLVVVSSYEEEKARRGWVDMQDLIVRTHALLRSDEGLRAELAARYRRMFVDEFQDTDAVQVAILMMLASEGPPPKDVFAAKVARGKLFIVGDPKQSIYRFRQADLAIYEAVGRTIVDSGGEIVTLTTSFRATPPIQHLVNVAFAEAMRGDGDGVQARYVPLTEARKASERQPAVIALPVPRPYGRRRLARSAIQVSLPDAIAAFVAWLVFESGFTVFDPRTEQDVPLAARHVAILFSKTKAYQSSLVAPIAKGLTERGVPHVALGSVGLSETEEGRALSNALSAIERTDDTLAVYATLHGALFGFDDATLFDYATFVGHEGKVGRLDPLRAKPEETPEDLRDVADALALLGRLHRLRNRRPTAETLHELCAATRAHVAFALSPTSEQALLVLASLERRAAAHDHRGGLSFRSFITALEEEDRGRELTDDEAMGVRILTVHAAKGLEFPVVILADPTSKPRAEVDRVVDVKSGLAALRLAGLSPRELLERAPAEQAAIAAESVRLAYVAATRARDLLVIPIVGDEPTFPEDGWLAPLQRAMVPTTPSRSEQAPLCPIMGADTVLDRPEPARSKLAPGLYMTKGGPVAFFDPKVLEAPRKVAVGKLELVAKDVSEEGSREEAEAHDRVSTARQLTIAAGSVPSLEVITATAHSHLEGATPTTDVALHRVPRETGRPGGKRFGILVHAVLAAANLDASASELEHASRSFGRLHGATDSEIDAAARAALAALAAPLMVEAQRAGQAGRLRREVPIAWEIDEGRIIDGVVDLAFFDGEAWQVVDYKTDDPSLLASESLGAYQAQVSLYVRAIHAATGQPARGALLFV